MSDKPNTTSGLEGIADVIGRSLHGDRWPEVQAASQATRRAAKLAADREARAERFNQTLGRIAAVIIVLALFAILSALSLAAWRWVL